MGILHRLIVVEGLPGSGKSTTAEAIRLLLAGSDPDLDVRFYEEGRTDHPADYEGFAYLTETEWTALESALPEWTKRLTPNENRPADIAAGGKLLGYRLFRERTGEELPDRVSRAIQGKDIYELPLALHIELIAASWTSFVQQAAAQKEDEAIIYLFECCFIQNPVTMGMIRCGAAPETTIGYVKRLEEIVQALNPLIVYADQRDLDYSFRKAKAERPAEWSEGFMEYYLQQGYGAAHVRLTEEDLPSEAALEQAVAGTIDILRARRKLEKEILGRLELPVIFIDNSDYDEAARARVLRRELVPFQLLIRGLRFPETHTL